MSQQAFKKYQRMSKRLEKLIAQGKDDEKADALRDEMDWVWLELTDKEQEQARKKLT